MTPFCSAVAVPSRAAAAAHHGKIDRKSAQENILVSTAKDGIAHRPAERDILRAAGIELGADRRAAGINPLQAAAGNGRFERFAAQAVALVGDFVKHILSATSEHRGVLRQRGIADVFDAFIIDGCLAVMGLRRGLAQRIFVGGLPATGIGCSSKSVVVVTFVTAFDTQRRSRCGGLVGTLIVHQSDACR